AWHAKHLPSSASICDMCWVLPCTTATSQLSHCPTRHPLGIGTPSASPNASKLPSLAPQVARRLEREKYTSNFSSLKGTRVSGDRNSSLKISNLCTPRSHRVWVRASIIGAGPHI